MTRIKGRHCLKKSLFCERTEFTKGGEGGFHKTLFFLKRNGNWLPKQILQNYELFESWRNEPNLGDILFKSKEWVLKACKHAKNVREKNDEKVQKN